MKIQNPHRVLRRILLDKSPIEAQLVVTRRCNLSCGYCTEYDDHSDEVPFEELERSIDSLHRLGVVNITMLGGEPLLHSRLEELVRHAAKESQVSITTNGFLLSDDKIAALNRAGLSNLQLSIDALEVDPSAYVQKTFKSLRPKLDRLAASAGFAVHCNLVLCEETLPHFEAIRAALERYPFALTVNLIHDERGQISVQGEEFSRKWRQHFRSGKALSFFEKSYGAALLRGERPRWKCRAGSRYLYIDEFSKVQLCSSQRGRLDVPLVKYTRRDLRRQERHTKGCEEGCAIFCAYRASQTDNAPLQALYSLAESALRGTFLQSSPTQAKAAEPAEASTPKRPPVRSPKLRVLDGASNKAWNDTRATRATKPR